MNNAEPLFSYFSPLTLEQVICICVGVVLGVALTLFVLWALLEIEARRYRACLREGRIIEGVR